MLSSASRTMNLSCLVNEDRFDESSPASKSPCLTLHPLPASPAHSMALESMSAQHARVPLTYSRTPQAPPSPPVEDARQCSLPSISSLLDIANNAAAQSIGNRLSLTQQQTILDCPQRSPYFQPNVSTPRGLFPPTPPMRQDPIDDIAQSPSAASTHSTTSSTSFIGNTNPAELQLPFHSPQSPPLSSHYQSAATSPTSATYYPPITCAALSPAMKAQRPLPTSFPPLVPILPSGKPSSSHSTCRHQDRSTSNQNTASWQQQQQQHHHYISPSSSTTFTQSQDRYICQTCQKAFSRPSSLRIHSHSHTGEKPFKCPHVGCGKAFSVRSNMKRHEKGCHSASTNAIPGFL